MIKVTLKDGSVKEFESKISVLGLAKSISEGLGRATLGGIVDGKLVDLRFEIDKDSKVSIVTFDDEEGKSAFRHTASHILAQAVKRLYPNAKLAIGPSIENGFYYDFDMEEVITPEILLEIEKEMDKIVKEKLQIDRFELPREEAIKLMEEKGEDYKVELINDLPEEETISFYKMGDFVDLCAGPHVVSTDVIKAFKLTSIAGAYWRGDSNKKMLQRIYGTAFPKKKDLDEHLNRLEEAKKRDNRKLGKELKLFLMMEEGPGFPFFLPKGMTLKNELIAYWRDLHKKYGYVEIETPIILNQGLWETSGHWYHYKENMYTLKIDEENYAIKPMSCPGGMLVYKSESHSYKDFPIRAAELGRVHRHELSGALHGLMRVRSFVQDDAHIFMLPEQIKDEIKLVIELVDKIYKDFGFKYRVELSTRPENSMGSDEDWNIAEESLKSALEEINMEYKLNEGDGAFYGPKIDFHLEDCIGRSWQCGTIQLDFQLPQKFDLNYIGKDGEKHKPIVIHRAILGSLERFMGILIEHFDGKFPLWISPTQVKILPISDKFNAYANKVMEEFNKNNIRVELDDRAEKIGYKIREARTERVPYILVVGEQEEQNETVSVRRRGEELGALQISDLINKITKEIKEKVID